MKTIYEVVQAIRSEIARGGKDGEYAKSLLGPRRRGSWSEVGLEDIDPSTPLEEFTPPEGARREGCRYLRALSFELGGCLGALPLSEVRALGLEVKLRSGPHGPELWAPAYAGAVWPAAAEFTIVVGPHEGRRVVFTWHPGEPLAPLPEGVKEPLDLEALHPDTGVKLS